MTWSERWTAAVGEALGVDAEASSARRTSASWVPVVEPGSITVRDDDLVVSIGVAALSPAEWSAIADHLVSRPADYAAVATGELPDAPDLLPSHLDLVPDRRRVVADCTCAVPSCRHVAALVAATADAIDLDPWLLVTLRGSHRAALIDVMMAARARQVGVDAPAASDAAPPTVDAAQAFARVPTPVPGPLPVLRRPAAPPDYLAPPADTGLDTDHLRRLVADAAHRAVDLLAGAEPAPTLPGVPAGSERS